MQPGSSIFAVNSSGRVFYLEQGSSVWKEFQYLGIEFKKIAAVKNVVWAIGGDHQIYVYVYGVEVPIRVKETFFENERWNPVEGFCANLLPTDRPHFSSMDGYQEKSRESIHLPTMAWVWDDEWHIETLFNGMQLPIGGWTYAVDFPAEYYDKKGFTSCVRRRKWIRCRKYVAIDSWSAVPGLNKDVCEEPFIDISIGGYDISGGNEAELMVWAVTVAGRIMVRQGVTDSNPEGSGWIHIPTPTGKEVSQLSVAASGLVWAVTWHGSVLVRQGISALDPTGNSWCEVGAPRPEIPLAMVSVGFSIVWGVGRDGSVWFRQGFKSVDSSASDVLIKGTKWIKMIGTVSMISVGLEDQVFSISPSSQNQDIRWIQMRTGVSPSDLSGKTWKTITAQAPFQSFRPSRGRSVSESSQKLRRFSGSSETPSEALSTMSVEPTASVSKPEDEPDVSMFNNFGNNIIKFSGEIALATAVGAVTQATVGRIPIVGTVVASAATRAVAQEVARYSASPAKTESESDPESESKPDSEPMQVESTMDESMFVSAFDKFDDSVPEVPAESMSARVTFDDDENEDGAGEPQWMWLTGGSCTVRNDKSSPDWFLETKRPERQKTIELEPWRQDIIASLISNNAETKKYSNFEDAIERSSWVKKGLIKFNLGGQGQRFEQAYLELEQCGSTENSVDFGTLSIFSTKSNFKEHISLSEITCISFCSEKSTPQLAVFTPKRSKLLLPIHIRFNSEKEMEEWHADLVSG